MQLLDALQDYPFPDRQTMAGAGPQSDVLVATMHSNQWDLLLGGGALQCQKGPFIRGPDLAAIMGPSIQKYGGDYIRPAIIAAFSYISDHQQAHGMAAPISMHSDANQKRSPALAEAGDRRQADDGKGGQPAFCRYFIY